MDFFLQYLQELKKTLDGVDVRKIKEISETLIQAARQGKSIFICGQGGSAALASHLCNDLSKLTLSPRAKRVKAISLVDNIPLLTAWMNDRGYESCFVEPLKNLFRKGDILIAVSTSGNSRSIIKAVEFANQKKGVTIALTGKSGGRLAGIARKSLAIPSQNMQRTEDAHLALCHMICLDMAQRLARKNS